MSDDINATHRAARADPIASIIYDAILMYDAKTWNGHVVDIPALALEAAASIRKDI